MYLYIGKRTRRNDPSTRRVFPAAIKFELKAHDVRTGLRLEEENVIIIIIKISHILRSLFLFHS